MSHQYLGVSSAVNMIAKVFVFCAVVAAVHGGLLGHGIISTGVSASSMKQDKMGNYAFGYDIVDGKGASNSRSEVGDAMGNKKGSYTLKDIDGRARTVDYVADKMGFRAAVKTNEPGTAMSAPAAAVISSPYAMPVAPVAKVLAPVAAPILGYGGNVAYGSSIAHGGNVAYGSSIAHGAPIVAPLGLGLHGLGLGLNGLGLGYGLGVGKMLY